MKLNFKTMKKNRIILIVAVFIVVAWMFMHSGGRVEFNEGEKSEALLYVENTEEPSPFILHGMVKKLTDDEEKQKKALTLATEKKYDELKEFLGTM
jgi:hypothetical protein